MLSLGLSSMNEFPEIGDDYEVVKRLGSGTYADVFEAIHKKSGRRVAIKKFNGIFRSETHVKRLIRELKIMGTLSQHPSICRLYSVIPPQDTDDFNALCLVIEYAETDLQRIIRSSIFLDLDQVRSIMYNLLLGLQYLHQAKVLHRDLKPANILINEDCSVRICDFGLSRTIAGLVSDVVNVVAPKEFSDTTPDSQSTGLTSNPPGDFESAISPKLTEAMLESRAPASMHAKIGANLIVCSPSSSSSSQSSPRQDPRHRALAADPNSSVSNCDSENEGGIISLQEEEFKDDSPRLKKSKFALK